MRRELGSLEARARVESLRAADPTLFRRVAALRDAVQNAGEASDANDEWSTWHRDLCRHVTREDPRRFLRWQPILGTMFAEEVPFVRAEFDELVAAGARGRLAEDLVGDPPPLSYAPDSSGNLVHHTYHLLRFHRATGRTLADYEQIVELGGGYGSMCRLALREGFGGRYVIADLPSFLALQRFYLDQLPAARPRLDDTILLVTGAALSGALLAGRRTLMIATWSLSEMPEATRGSLLDAVLPHDPDHLLAYQPRFSGIDNVAWFDALRQAQIPAGMTEPIEQLDGHRYLFAAA